MQQQRRRCVELRMTFCTAWCYVTFLMGVLAKSAPSLPTALLNCHIAPSHQHHTRMRVLHKAGSLIALMFIFSLRVLHVQAAAERAAKAAEETKKAEEARAAAEKKVCVCVCVCVYVCVSEKEREGGIR